MTASFVLTSARQLEVAKNSIENTWKNPSAENREAKNAANALGAFISDTELQRGE